MKVYELLNSESKWCRNTLARDEWGEACDPFSNDACKWCAGGALRICYPPYMLSTLIAKLQAVIKGSLSKWNDDPETTFEMVHSLFKEQGI